MCDPTSCYERLKLVHDSCRYFYQEQLSSVSKYTEEIPRLMTSYGVYVRTGLESLVEKACQSSPTKLHSVMTYPGFHTQISGFKRTFDQPHCILPGFRYPPALDSTLYCRRQYQQEKTFGKRVAGVQSNDECEHFNCSNISASCDCNCERGDIGSDVDSECACGCCEKNSPDVHFCSARVKSAEISETMAHHKYIKDRPRDRVRVGTYDSFFCNYAYYYSSSSQCNVSESHTARISNNERRYRLNKRRDFAAFHRGCTLNDRWVQTKDIGVQTELHMEMFPVCDFGGNAPLNASAFSFPYKKAHSSKTTRLDIEIDAINEAFNLNKSAENCSNHTSKHCDEQMSSVLFINKDDVTFQVTFYGQKEIVAKSGHSVVFSATFCRPSRKPEHVVIKLSDFSDSQILQEAWILSRLNNTGYVPYFFGVMTSTFSSTGKEGLGLVSEFFGSGLSLKAAIRLNFDILMYPEFWVNICVQIARGLLRIHENDVIIGELCDTNILVDCNLHRHIDCRIRFINFSRSIYRKGQVLTNSSGLIKDHVAPEIREGCPVTVQSDIYSFGAILLQIALSGRFPAVVDIAHSCMHPHPAFRPNHVDILNRLHCLRLDISVNRETTP